MKWGFGSRIASENYLKITPSPLNNPLTPREYKMDIQVKIIYENIYLKIYIFSI